MQKIEKFPIGVICDINENSSMKILGGHRRMRIIPLAKILNDNGIKLFIYSMYQVDIKTKTVTGYYINDGKFIQTTQKIPKINAIWFYGGNRGKIINAISKSDFRRWADENNINIYPSYNFNCFSIDKYATYCFFNKVDQSLQPTTQLYLHSKDQLQTFLDANDRIFLKPRYGSCGENIIVVRNEPKRTIEHYKNNTIEILTADTIEQTANAIKHFSNHKKLIIQSGINTIKYNNRDFHVRAIMLHDGVNWNCVHKLGCSPENKAVSNSSQGSTDFVTEEAFSDLYGADADMMCGKIENTAHAIADLLEKIYPQKIMEFCMDFLFDKKNNLYLGEIDMSPGLIKPGMDPNKPFIDILNPTEKEQILYDRYLIPHAECLAKFLLSRASKFL